MRQYKIEDVLRYEDNLFGLNCHIFYSFMNEGLYQVRYEIKTDGHPFSWCVESYEILKEKLVAKHGEAKKEGSHAFWLTWENEETKIVLHLVQYNFGTELLVEYTKNS